MYRHRRLQQLLRACTVTLRAERSFLTNTGFQAAPQLLAATEPAVLSSAAHHAARIGCGKAWSVSLHSCAAAQSQAQAVTAEEDNVAAAKGDPAAAAPASAAEDSFLKQGEKVKAGPHALYCKGRLGGLYRKDARQEATVLALQRLYDELAILAPRQRSRPSGLTLVDNIDGASKEKAAWWQSLSHFITGPADPQQQPPRSKGLYMFGGVGVGKTMLMDLFVAAVPPEFKVQRSHFHDFMLEVHAHLRVYSSHQDPLAQVARHVLQSTKVLCLDEFFVTDVADAAMLARLFGHMWDGGLVLVATSNRAPDSLYEGGLQRNLFLPFISRLKKETIVHDMASPTDYRRLAQHRRGLYFTPVDFANPDAEVEHRFEELAHAFTMAPARIQVKMGRHLDVPLAGGPIAKFDFQTLCGRPVAAADYIALADAYHTLMLTQVPIFTAANRSEAYRFQILVDVLYEHRTRLFCSAEGQPWELFNDVVTQTEARIRRKVEGDEHLVIDDNLGFAKERVISRLTEMQSLEYLIAHAEVHAPELLLALKEAAAAEKAKHEQPRRKN